MTQDEQHLNLLSILHYVLGGLIALPSALFLWALAVGITEVLGHISSPVSFDWLVFVLLPSWFILVDWTVAGTIIGAGNRLRRRASWTFCLVVAALECLLIPLGTVLGVFTIVVLMKDSVSALFAANQPVPATSP